MAFAGSVEALDTDNDGTVDQEEAKADPAVAEQFTAIDANGDGVIDAAEFAAFQAPAAEGEAAE